MAKKNLQVRLDEKLKRKVEKIFEQVGIDTPTAIRVFFAKVVDVGGIPFLLQHSERTYTPQQIGKIDRMAAQAKRGKCVSGTFDSTDALLEDLHS